MADPRSPLITSITNNPTPEFKYMEDNRKLPTVFALSQILSGMATKGAGATNGLNYNSADQIVYSGVYHFGKDELGEIPSDIESGGMLVVYHERETNNTISGHEPDFGNTAADTTGYAGHKYIRQVIWPDGPDFITPFTRTGELTSSGVYVWTDWQTLGGGGMPRIEMTGNIGAAGIKPNSLYYSNGAYTLTLPDPASYSPGTKIGLEQYADGGHVTYTSNGVTTTMSVYPAHAATANGADSGTILGPNIYIFEAIVNNNGVAEWILDVDNNINTVVMASLEAFRAEMSEINDTWFAALNQEKIDRANADNTEKDLRIAADGVLTQTIGDGFTETDTVRAKTDDLEQSIDIIEDRLGDATKINTSDKTVAKEVTRIDSTLGAEFNTSNTVQKRVKSIEDNIDLVEADVAALETEMKFKGRATVFVSRSASLGLSDGFPPPDGSTTLNFTQALNKFDLHINMSVSGATVTLPASGTVPKGAKVTIELPGANHKIYLKENGDSSSETFTNDTGHVLLLPLENTYSGWTLIVAG